MVDDEFDPIVTTLRWDVEAQAAELTTYDGSSSSGKIKRVERGPILRATQGTVGSLLNLEFRNVKAPLTIDIPTHIDMVEIVVYEPFGVTSGEHRDSVFDPEATLRMLGATYTIRGGAKHLLSHIDDTPLNCSDI